MSVTPLRPIDAPLYDPRHEHDACGVGFIADLDGRHAARTVPMALEALAALAHRGARAADDRTGDGAGISIPISPRFGARLLAEAGLATRPRGRLAVAMCFLPAGARAAAEAAATFETHAAAEGLTVAGWRDVPIRAALVADRAVGETPTIRQAIVVGDARLTPLAFARRLAILRRAAEQDPSLTVASLSPRQLVYKGLFVGDELGRFYDDLSTNDLDARYAVFHQRYSTNTFPSWRLAQPFGYLAHNGEINTVRANRQAMRGRRSALGGGRWARRLAEIGPLVTEDGSDSQSLDDAVELLVLSGMPVDEAIGTLIPAAPGLGGPATDPAGARSEPWDGPAALVFSDGRRVGCLLDRNGLRPLALTATSHGLLIVSSEAGSVELPSARVIERRRLGPGDQVVIDVATGRVVSQRMAPHASSPPVAPRRLVPARAKARPPADDRLRFAHGLDAEVLRQVIRPMAVEGHEPIWSMGDDTPIAPLARRPRRVTAFLRQAFAQVTNPAIDPERERAVMSLAMAVGRQPDLLGPVRPTDAVVIESPIMDANGWTRLSAAAGQVRVLDATWPASRGARGLAFGLARLGRHARAAARRGIRLVVVSDRAADGRRIPIPSVLAVGRVHQELVAAGRRSRTDVAVAAGDAFDIHDIAMLLGAGASAVHPWLLLELAAEQAGERGAEELEPAEAVANAIAALEQGLRKVLARMGISALASYRGGQIIDVIGLDSDLVRRCFPAANHWPGSTGAAEIGRMLVVRHRIAFGPSVPALEDPGLVRFRGSGEAHAFAPKVVKALQAAVDTDAGLSAYREQLDALGHRQPRDLLAVRPAGQPLPINEVEPASRIARRFVSSAMSLGALSPEAHQAISIGMARLGASANSGEGGEDPAWYVPSTDGDRRDAAIKQVASARFGVTAEYLARAEQLEIKIAQGSKPGEGGQLPGRKATAFIAGLRRGQPGMTMISPPPHHDIYSIEDLAQLISDLRAVNPTARIGVKLVAGAGVGTIAAGVAKAHADYILLSGHAGGTGASPLSSIKHAGLPWELGLAETHQVLVRNRLRDRVALRTDGGLQTGRDVVVAAMLGAEEYGFGTAALVAIGCDMARQCHLDTCPTGIATQREDLRAKFTGTPERVVAFFTALADDVRRELAALGLRTLGEAVGRTDLLRAIDPGRGIELQALLGAPPWAPPTDAPPKDRPRWAERPADGSFEADALDDLARRVADGETVHLRGRVTTRDRAIGARLSGALQRRPEPRQLPHVTYELTGSAGQSLGAFAVAGLRIVVSGEANDYVGKGLSGATVVVRPAAGTAQDQAVAGNVCLFGATAGVLHLVGRAGMRFAVRNSGARAVVEGIGAHGCEYMTGGTVVVLGSIGPNFGAGMTGGRAYLLDADPERLNPGVLARPLDDDRPLRDLLAAHAAEGSRNAADILVAWDEWRDRFAVVEPRATDAPASIEPLAMAR
jgi:glutamate synthase domain-containing protein 2/glutamate synthase domain-containing protein 1/glutamate synthase domain-containing protein 3